MPLPPELKRFFVEVSSGLDFYWFLNDKVTSEPPREVSEVQFGMFDVNLFEIVELSDRWESWEQPSNSVDENEAYHGLFPFLATTNGDFITIATQGAFAGRVVYADHEGGKFDRQVLGESLLEFLDVWCHLGCPGPESWALAPFYDESSRRLSLEVRNSRIWLAAIGL